MVKSEYQRGYVDGVKKARSIINEDIKHIYGIMCICLKEDGNTDEECWALIQKIQNRWNEVVQNGIDVREYVHEKLDFDIEQI